MGQTFARGKSSFTEISVFESLSWHSCDGFEGAMVAVVLAQFGQFGV